MKTLAVALALLLSGCGSLLNAELQKEEGIFVVEPYDISWATKATDNAIDFWFRHGVRFHQSAYGDVQIVVTENLINSPTQAAAECGPRGVIKIRPEEAKNERLATCLLAHELGHFLGMNHVAQGQSLLAPVVKADPGGDCYWSDEDEIEYEKAEGDVGDRRPGCR